MRSSKNREGAWAWCIRPVTSCWAGLSHQVSATDQGQSADRGRVSCRSARASSLNHPTSSRSRNSRTESGDAIVMEFIRGRTLNDVLAAAACLPPMRCVWPCKSPMRSAPPIPSDRASRFETGQCDGDAGIAHQSFGFRLAKLDSGSSLCHSTTTKRPDRSISTRLPKPRKEPFVGTVLYVPERRRAARWTLVPISFPSARFSTNFSPASATFKGKTKSADSHGGAAG